MAVATNSELIRKNLEAYISLMQEHGYPLWRVYLFGSYAKGTAHKDSDIDVAVFLDQEDINGFRENVELALLGSKIDSRIEPRTYARPDIDAPNPFIDNIVRTGLRLL